MEKKDIEGAEIVFKEYRKYRKESAEHVSYTQWFKKIRHDFLPTAEGEPKDVEKERRIYYQSIVYDVCTIIDTALGKKPGSGLVCGNVSEPNRDVQDAIRRLIYEKEKK